MASGTGPSEWPRPARGPSCLLSGRLEVSTLPSRTRRDARLAAEHDGFEAAAEGWGRWEEGEPSGAQVLSLILSIAGGDDVGLAVVDAIFNPKASRG